MNGQLIPDIASIRLDSNTEELAASLSVTVIEGESSMVNL